MQTTIKIAALTLCAALALSACAAAAQPGDTANAAQEDTQNVTEDSFYRKITPEQAKEKMDAGGVTVVDVRTLEEYTEKHIPGAVLVPLDTIGDTQPDALPDKDAVLLVYCRSGRKSAAAAVTLAGLGYKNVYDFGGIIDWPYETEAGAPDEQ